MHAGRETSEAWGTTPGLEASSTATTPNTAFHFCCADVHPGTFVRESAGGGIQCKGDLGVSSSVSTMDSLELLLHHGTTSDARLSSSRRARLSTTLPPPLPPSYAGCLWHLAERRHTVM